MFRDLGFRVRTSELSTELASFCLLRDAERIYYGGDGGLPRTIVLQSSSKRRSMDWEARAQGSRSMDWEVQAQGAEDHGLFSKCFFDSLLGF